MLNKANILLDEINEIKKDLKIKERELKNITRKYNLTILENEIVEDKLVWGVEFDIDANGYFLYEEDEYMHNLKQGCIAFNNKQKQELQPILDNIEKMIGLDDEGIEKHELYDDTFEMLSKFQQKHNLSYCNEKIQGFSLCRDERGNIKIDFDVDWNEVGEDGCEHYFISICKINIYNCVEDVEIIEER